MILQETERDPRFVTTPPHPITPPLSRDEEFAALRLLRSRKVGPATYFRLIGEHGSPAAALAALPAIARASGLQDYEICPEGVVAAELRAGAKCGARLLALGSADYPAALADISDAPPLLWARGRVELAARVVVGLVGARNASSLGLRMARALAEGLSQAGVVVASGLARGVDTAAHLAAVAGGTIAVLPGGVDVVYPPENADLMARLAIEGLLLSEQPVGLVPQARHFPRRNRLISGLAKAVVVVEAAADSGSLITAREALEQGRDVMAVPGHPMDARAAGCNMLIRDGALLVRGAEDVCAALGLAAAPRRTQTAPKPAKAASQGTESDAMARILALLGPSPLAEDQLNRDAQLPVNDISAALTALELDGRIERRAGGMVARL